MEKSAFNELKLSEELLKAIGLLNYTSPTKVQGLVIPVLLEHKDVIVKSQTGSGKTGAFAIPLCQLVAWEQNKPQALVIEPTRELALQVREELFNIGRFKRLKVAAVYGKAPFEAQVKELKQKTHIVVGTPGRLLDHTEKGTLDLAKIKYLVIDEADKLLQMGFIEQIEAIIADLPQERLTALLSATLPADIMTLCDQYMKAPVLVEIAAENSTLERIEQERYQAEEPDKLSLLRDLTCVENPDSCIIFCNTKLRVDEVYEELKQLGYPCRKIHGGMEQRDRLSVMNAFKRGKFRYLVATDVAARGIDIDDISLVINYDVPEDRESYVHRIGRTGRLDKPGKAITLVSRDEHKLLEDIQAYIGKELAFKRRASKHLVDKARQKFMDKAKERPEPKTSKGARLNTEIMKLHINAGKKTKMRAVDIVGTLCNIEGITASDIGIIDIQGISTFVEILNNKGDVVYRELQDRPIKGRLRKVSKAT